MWFCQISHRQIPKQIFYFNCFYCCFQIRSFFQNYIFLKTLVDKQEKKKRKLDDCKLDAIGSGNINVDDNDNDNDGLVEQVRYNIFKNLKIQIQN